MILNGVQIDSFHQTSVATVPTRIAVLYVPESIQLPSATVTGRYQSLQYRVISQNTIESAATVKSARKKQQTEQATRQRGSGTTKEEK